MTVLEKQELIRCIFIDTESDIGTRHQFCTNHQSPVKFVSHSEEFSRDLYPHLSENKFKLRIGLRSRNEWKQRGSALDTAENWDNYPPDMTEIEFDADKIETIKFVERKRPHSVGTQQWHNDDTYRNVLEINKKQIEAGLEKDPNNFLKGISDLIFSFDIKLDDVSIQTRVSDIYDFDEEFGKFKENFKELGLEKKDHLSVLEYPIGEHSFNS